MIDYVSAIHSSKSYKMLEKDVENGKLSHSYMLIDKDKETIKAYIKEFSKLIYTYQKSEEEKRQIEVIIENNNHTNITTIDSDSIIKVDDIKELIEDTYLTSFTGGLKLYVIVSGERMNEASQNKLLKTLEEPNKNVCILLATTNENAMLQTIKSRCKKIYLNVWNKENIRSELQKSTTDNDLVDIASRFSGDNISRAFNIIVDEDFKEKFNNVEKVLYEYKGSSNIIDFLNIFGVEKAEVISHLEIFEGIIFALLKEKKQGYNNAILINIYEQIIDTYKRLDSNCNPQNAVYNLLMQIAEIKYNLSE